MAPMSPLERLRVAQKIGFVFSGGSARCAFQIGVIERLAELGVRPSMAIGVSAGSWNAAFVAAHRERRLRYFWRTFVRQPHLDLRKLFVDLTPWRYAHLHRRNCTRFLGTALHQPEALPLFVSLTRLRDRQNVIFDARQVADPFDVLIAANYLPPFYTRAPRLLGERYGDGAVTDNAPYEHALAAGCDMVVLVVMKGESEGGLYKNLDDLDHEIPAALQDRVVVIRPRHRLPVAFTERNWTKLSQLIHIGDLRTREVLLGETHPETELRADGASFTTRVSRLFGWIRGAGGRAAVQEGPGPA